MYIIKSGEEMTKKQVLQALQLDRMTYPREYWLDEETVTEYLRTHPEVYVFAEDENGKLIAYLNMSCIDKLSFKELLSGKENDLCIKAENLRFPEKGADNILYFSSVAVGEKYKGRGIARALFNAMAEKFKALMRDGVYFTYVIADAVSVGGEKLCRAFGMEKVLSTSRGSGIFLLKADKDEPFSASETLINGMTS